MKKNQTNDSTEKKTKNKGEISEVYIFLKLLLEGKIQLTKNSSTTMQKAFLDVISILREEKKGFQYRYYPVDKEDYVHIKLNGEEVKKVKKNEFEKWTKKIWELISTTKKGGIVDNEISAFLKTLFVNSISSPCYRKTEFFGGVIDIFIETKKDGIIADIGFSAKSEFSNAATVFNASIDNSNFIYRLKGKLSDNLMNQFNDIWVKNKDNSFKISATGHKVADLIGRMKFLKTNKIEMVFDKNATNIAKGNLVMSGGQELPLILGSMLQYFYYDTNSSSLFVKECLDYLVDNDPADYKIFEDPKTMYKTKICKFLYDVAMGMKLGHKWDGKHDVSGGYIIVNKDGSLTAYHTTVEDQFKDYLFSQLQFEKPSATRHKYMEIYKENDKYYLKLNLQLRFPKILNEE